jgi:hypothetical protein
MPFFRGCTVCLGALVFTTGAGRGTVETPRCFLHGEQSDWFVVNGQTLEVCGHGDHEGAELFDVGEWQ